MREHIALIPAPSGTGSDYIELARSKQGRVFRKHILNKGDLIHPTTRERVKIDDEFVGHLIENFNSRVCDIVQVPLAGPANEHTEDPSRNIGEVIGIESDGGKVYALIDARDATAAGQLGKTLIGASAMLHMNYPDNREPNKKVGPTLLHVAVTNRPYVTGLDEYEELIAASADTYSEKEVVLLTEGVAMTKEELLAELKRDHGVDVSAMQVALAAAQGDSELVVKLGAALADSDYVELSAGQEISTADVLTGITALAQENVDLKAKVADSLALTAVSEVDQLITEGRILPAQKAAMVELKLSNAELFASLVPEQPLIKLSVETGTLVGDENGQQQEDDLDAEVARLTAKDSPLAQRGFIKVEG